MPMYLLKSLINDIFFLIISILSKTEYYLFWLKMGRRKITCPVCLNSFGYLPRQLRKKHGWEAKKAATALNDFGIRKNCKVLSEENRKGRKCVYNNLRICTYRNCKNEVRRIHNHLCQVHKLKLKSKIDEAEKNPMPVLQPQSSESSCSSEEEASEEEPIINFNILGQEFSSDDDGDQD